MTRDHDHRHTGSHRAGLLHHDTQPGHASRAAALRKGRAPYKLLSNNCATFAEDVITQDASVDRPNIAVHSPNNTVSEYQEEGNAKVTYDPKATSGTPRLTIGTWDESDAKR